MGELLHDCGYWRNGEVGLEVRIAWGGVWALRHGLHIAILRCAKGRCGTTGRCGVMSGDRHSEYSRQGVLRSATYRKTLARTVQQIRSALLAREMREDAGLAQAEIAKIVGTTQSVIARREDPEYTGHSLTMLERMAAAGGVALKLRAEKRPNFEREVALV
jgi:ribosome-binding protein aMBF1 (putative translation factor)